jgi:hypothetical protein|tara:strand:- start:347 stop:499 length:153 start_codon:yes stop_codon:yes gene_type:complete
MPNTITLTDPITLQQYIVDESYEELTPPDEMDAEDTSEEATQALANLESE